MWITVRGIAFCRFPLSAHLILMPASLLKLHTLALPCNIIVPQVRIYPDETAPRAISSPERVAALFGDRTRSRQA